MGDRADAEEGQLRPRSSAAATWSVFKDSKNKDAAWAFVQYLTDPKTQVAWYGEVGDLPAVQSAWDDPALTGDKNVALFGEQLKDTKAQPATATWSELGHGAQRHLEKMTTGGHGPAGGRRRDAEARPRRSGRGADDDRLPRSPSGWRAEAAPRPPPADHRRWRDDLTGWAFAAPFVILFGVFLAFPILASFLLSFTSFGLRDLANPLGTSVVGIDNYVTLLGDAKFWKALAQHRLLRRGRGPADAGHRPPDRRPP